MKDQITQLYFSPGGTTARIANAISSTLAKDVQTVDLIKDKPTTPQLFHADDLILVAMPVFSGRIPSVCVDMLKKIQGTNTPAIAIVVYGNREYEDALLELTDILSAQGFIAIGAAAFVARHSIFPEVAKERPNADDTKLMQDFAGKCLEKLAGETMPVTVNGNRPYRATGPLPLHPTGSASCTRCGVCAKICPVGAIDPATPKKTDKARCITCTACIYLCPSHARAFRGFMYKVAGKSFAKKCSSPKVAETFV